MARRPTLPEPSAERGSYVLLLRARTAARASVGRLGDVALRPGHYLYVGSAFGPGGVRARVARHCRTDKPRHWHLDHVREHLEPTALWCCHAPERLEHVWARALLVAPGLEPVAGFSASDCDCPSHLFHARRRPTLALLPRAVRDGVVRRRCPSVSR